MKMKKMFKIGLCMIAGVVLNALPAIAGEMSSDGTLKELNEMKSRIERLESSEINDIEKDWMEKISISGLIEVEAGHASMKYKDSETPNAKNSDITLATVELGIDAEINKHVSGHVLLLWEEDDTEPVDLDEGYITLSGEDVLPLYLSAGKMYVPFGSFNSHFISDPITLEIGETRESAIRAGFANDLFDISISIFNGDIEKISGDDRVKSWVANAIFTLPEDAVSGFGLSLGASYISNIAESDGLEGEVLAGAINDYVSGVGYFLNASVKERFFIGFEYVGARERFAPGDLSFDNGLAYKPRAYNLEFAWAANDDLLMGIKYGKTKELGDLLPERQYGCVLTYGLFKYTTVGIEYLSGKYENGDKSNLFTAQLAVEF
ncbi:MAG: LbtU family siderophore porin [Desulfatiglans sp.]|nr:LbtU family siderophore porin [Desulfatiglans sp.]